MARKTALALALAILLASLLASCGKGTTDNASSGAAETPAASSQVSEISSEPTETPSSEEATTEAPVSSEETSTEETSTEAPFVPTPVPEDLPGIDSPAPPEEVRCYLPLEGVLQSALDPEWNCTRSIRYEGNALVFDDQYEGGYEIQSEFRFDDQGKLLEFTDRDWRGEWHHDLYTYDAEGRMTSAIRETRDLIWETVDRSQTDYFYDENGDLCREVLTAPDLEGGTGSITLEYTHTYGEDGVLTKLTETGEDGSYNERLYEDGRETVRRYIGNDGELIRIYAYEYDEAGRLTRERFRSTIGNFVYTDTYFYEEGRLLEVRRDEGDGAQLLRQYVYDAYGRETVGFQDGAYTLSAYAENGALCKTALYLPEEEGGEALSVEVTAWGDEATTELQLALCRFAVNSVFGGWDAGSTDHFYASAYPKP